MGDTPPVRQNKPPVKPIPRVEDPAQRSSPGAVKLPGSNLPLPLAQSVFGNTFLARLLAGQGLAATPPTPADGFKKEFENQFVPSAVKGRVEVAAPSLRRGVP